MPRHTASGLAVLVVALALGSGVSRGADPTILYFEQRAADVRLSKAATREGDSGASQAYGTPLDVVSLRMEWEVPIRDEDLFRMAVFKNLEVLWINHGRPSAKALAVLAGFPKLRELHISYCGPLGKLTWIAGLRELKHLQLVGCGLVDEDLQPLSELDGLEVLFLSHSPLKGPGLQFLSRHTRLVLVHLDQTRVDGASLQWLAECKALEYVGIESTRVDDAGLAQLSKLPRLCEIDADDTRIGDAGVIAIAKLPALRFLHFAGCPVGDRGLSALAGSSSIEHIGASRTRITDAGLLTMAGLKSLREIDVGATAVTPEGVARFRSHRPEVRVNTVVGPAQQPLPASEDTSSVH